MIVSRGSTTLVDVKRLVAMILLTTLPIAPLSAQSFDAAIDHALDRSVKLYGLGAGREAGYGSGIFVSADGDILTVLSLLIDARRIKVVTRDGTEYQAQVVRRDPQRQLALLRITGLFADPPSSSVPPVDPASISVGPFPFFDLDSIPVSRIGETVLAIGNPFRIAEGRETMSVSRGVLSARIPLDATRRTADFPYRGDVLAIDAITSNPGFPGGALVNAEGRLLGMIGREVSLTRTHTHLNYAMPAEVLAAFLHESRQPPEAEAASGRATTVEPARPVDLGLRLARTGYRKQLAFVDRVVPGSPAAAAGVRVDDLILVINGRQVTDISVYDTVLPTLRPGEIIELVLRRDKQIISVQLTVPATAETPPK